MSSHSVIPVILSGGSGSRLWPLSREHYPKQFLSLMGENTMLQETISRLDGFLNIGKPIVVCNEEHRFLVAEQMQSAGHPTSAIILEPARRNTAPAVAVSAFKALILEDNPVLLVLPADHIIQKTEVFQKAVTEGLEQASNGNLVTFGIVPDEPETGYGYIKKGDKLPSGSAHRVSKFVEKPDKNTAISYIDSGQYLWNSGIFMFHAQHYLDELSKYAPEIYEACRSAVKQANLDLDFTRLHKDSFEASPSDSIDYAVMEKTQNAIVIPLDAGWSDVGSWSSLAEVHQKDSQGNVKIGDTLSVDTKDSYLHSTGRLIATVGLENLIVIETADAVLVANKNDAQNVKQVVSLLKSTKSNCNKSQSHRKIYRPWGSFDCIDKGARFQVKRIIVNPGATLSLQMHYHRAEHWIIVKGTARVTNGDAVLLLEENQSTYIPLGVQHRLENPGSIPLEIIEVQSGGYLGEDDIVRFDDIYGRG